jgi:hypothetical protein
MFFATINPDIRLSHLLQNFTLRSMLQLPTNVDYYDYNFNNAQTVKAFEDIASEALASSYVYSDYLKIH